MTSHLLTASLLAVVGFTIYSDITIKHLVKEALKMAKTRQLPPAWTRVWTIEEVLARPFLPEVASLPWHKLRVPDWRMEQDRLIDRLCKLQLKTGWHSRSIFPDDTLNMVWPWLDWETRGLLEGMWISENAATYARIEREGRVVVGGFPLLDEDCEGRAA